MTDRTLQHLIAEAVALGGGNLCASGHDWESAGGRACINECGDSVEVRHCKRCGDYDYGDEFCERCSRGNHA